MDKSLQKLFLRGMPINILREIKKKENQSISKIGKVVGRGVWVYSKVYALEESGLIERIPKNKREKGCFLTEKGKKVLENMEKIIYLDNNNNNNNVI